ncbi:hypothetical protein BFP77_14085 [Maribacter sp. 4U21]|nr:hypothetical protein BFP77_14085 [Maribacter sp. 4U21]
MIFALTANKNFALLLFLAGMLFCSHSYGQCPGPDPCPPGSFDPEYEQIDPSSIAGAVFCSGQTRTFTIGVGPGTTDEAESGDEEYITLFIDFDCDGIFEYSVSDSCIYQRPNGCSVDLSVTAPTVTVPTTFNARAMLRYFDPITDPCGEIFDGDIEDFTITVNVPPDPVLTSSDADNTICDGDSVTFTASGGDEYEFFVNGTSVQPLSTANTYTTSGLLDGDSVTVTALYTSNGCDTESTPIAMTVLDPVFTTQPVDRTSFAGDNVVFSVTTSEVVTYQWQVSRDGGTTFTDIFDSTEYSGTGTANLTVNSVDVDKDNYRYRALMTSCAFDTSAAAILTVRPRTVVTNRRVTYRVIKN